MRETKRNNSAICNALLENGHSKLKFEIILYCLPII